MERERQHSGNHPQSGDWFNLQACLSQCLLDLWSWQPHVHHDGGFLFYLAFLFPPVYCIIMEIKTKMMPLQTGLLSRRAGLFTVVYLLHWGSWDPGWCAILEEIPFLLIRLWQSKHRLQFCYLLLLLLGYIATWMVFPLWLRFWPGGLRFGCHRPHCIGQDSLLHICQDLFAQE